MSLQDQIDGLHVHEKMQAEQLDELQKRCLEKDEQKRQHRAEIATLTEQLSRARNDIASYTEQICDLTAALSVKPTMEQFEQVERDKDSLIADLSEQDRQLESRITQWKQASDYSIDLQRLIESFCKGRELPSPNLHHSKMLKRYRTSPGMVE